MQRAKERHPRFGREGPLWHLHHLLVLGPRLENLSPDGRGTPEVWWYVVLGLIRVFARGKQILRAASQAMSGRNLKMQVYVHVYSDDM